MKPIKHIVWELVLILASVLIFRGLWHLMDYILDLNSIAFLVISTVLGIFLAGIAIRRLTHVH